MPGRPKDPRRRLASGRQLWRLNELGRLRLVEDASPISSNEAKVLISAEFETMEISRLAHTLAHTPRQRRG